MEKIGKSNFQLQKNTTKYNPIIMMVLSSLFSCSNELQEIIYKYNSDEYHKKQKEFNISLEEANKIASEFYFENHPDSKEYNFTLDFILDDSYIFCEPGRLYNLKTTQYFLKGIWVNGKTGKVIYKNTDEYVKILFDIPFSSLNSYSGTIKRPD